MIAQQTRRDVPVIVPPLGDEQAGGEDCSHCLGEGKVPVFEGRGGVSMPAGYKRCECNVAEENEGDSDPEAHAQGGQP